MYKDLVQNCKAQEGASDSDIQEIASHKLPSTRPGQCLNACVLENVGMVKNTLAFYFYLIDLIGIYFVDLDKRW